MSAYVSRKSWKVLSNFAPCTPNTRAPAALRYSCHEPHESLRSPPGNSFCADDGWDEQNQNSVLGSAAYEFSLSASRTDVAPCFLLVLPRNSVCKHGPAPTGLRGMVSKLAGRPTVSGDSLPSDSGGTLDIGPRRGWLPVLQRTSRYPRRRANTARKRSGAPGFSGSVRRPLGRAYISDVVRAKHDLTFTFAPHGSDALHQFIEQLALSDHGSASGSRQPLDLELAGALLGYPEIVLHLLIQPALGRGIECLRQA